MDIDSSVRDIDPIGEAKNALNELLDKTETVRLSNFEKMQELSWDISGAADRVRDMLETTKSGAVDGEVELDIANDFVKEVKKYEDVFRFYRWARDLTSSESSLFSSWAGIKKIKHELEFYRNNLSRINEFDPEGSIEELVKTIRASVKKYEWENGGQAKSETRVAIILAALTVAFAFMLIFSRFGALYIISLILFTGSSIAVSVYSRRISRKISSLSPYVLSGLIAFGYSLLTPIKMANADIAVWYIPLFISVIVIAGILCQGHSNVILGIIIAVMLFVGFLVVALIIHTIAAYMRETEFLDGFFGAIGNVFLGLWDIVSGLVVGVIQNMMLVIGAGYWLPGFYEGFFIGPAVLNTIVYGALVLFVVLAAVDSSSDTKL